MNVNFINGTAVLVAVVTSVAAALRVSSSQGGELNGGELSRVAETQAVERDGVRGVVDASGHFVPLKRYERIVSTSTVADSLLLALCERDRIVAVSRQPEPGEPFGYRLAGLPALPSLQNVEQALSLAPDLVLVHNLERIDNAQKLRRAGIEVFDLGGMHGLSTLLPNIRTVALLLGRPQRGVDLARRFARRMDAIAARIPAEERPRALYIGVHGDKLYGGTRGTSFHDVLNAAGLRDAAAERFRGWPRYSSEELLLLDPDIVVTQEGMREVLCAQAGLSALRACRGEGKARIIELPPSLILLPGLNMLEAAEALHEAVYLDAAAPPGP